jgi:hypothetical protein
MRIEIETASAGEPLAAVRDLWQEYWTSLGFPPDFQNFAAELDVLPGAYGCAT